MGRSLKVRHFFALTLLFILASMGRVPAQFNSPFMIPPYGFGSPSLRAPPLFSNVPFYPQPAWSRPSYPAASYYRAPLPPSPVRQCRSNGACRELDHGTTLANSWRIQTTTTPTPAYISIRTKAPGIDRSETTVVTSEALSTTFPVTTTMKPIIDSTTNAHS